MQTVKHGGLLGAACLLLGGIAAAGCQGVSADETTCGAGETVCNDECFNLAVDPRHCGGCGVRCADGHACRGGVCTIVCGDGTTACGGACVYLALDSANCGACGNDCGADHHCGDGVCLDGPPPAPGGGSSSRPDDHCSGCGARGPWPPGPSGNPPPRPM